MSDKNRIPKQVPCPLAYVSERVGSSGLPECRKETVVEGLQDENCACICIEGVASPVCHACSSSCGMVASDDVCVVPLERRNRRETMVDIMLSGTFVVVVVPFVSDPAICLSVVYARCCVMCRCVRECCSRDS